MDYFHQMTDPLTTQFTLHREDLGDRGILVKFSLDRAPYLNYPNDAVLIALVGTISYAREHWMTSFCVTQVARNSEVE